MPVTSHPTQLPGGKGLSGFCWLREATGLLPTRDMREVLMSDDFIERDDLGCGLTNPEAGTLGQPNLG